MAKVVIGALVILFISVGLFAFALVGDSEVGVGTPGGQPTSPLPGLDINGDGTNDLLIPVLEGTNHLEARDGVSGKLLWSSPCWMKSLGDIDRLRRPLLPLFFDVNQDGAGDLIFIARGCHAVVALDQKTGTTLWQIPLKDTLGKSGKSVLGKDPLQWWERDLTLADGHLLLAVRASDALTVAEKAVGGVIEARNPRDGSLLWRSPLPLKSSAKSTGWGIDLEDVFDGLRQADGASAILTLTPSATGATPTTSVSAPVSSGGSATVSFSAEKPIVLNGIADTARFLAVNDRVIYAGVSEVRAISSKNGNALWAWNNPNGKKLFNPALMHHGGSVLVVGWVEKKRTSMPKEIILALLDESTGRPRWMRVIDNIWPGRMGIMDVVPRAGGQLKVTMDSAVKVEYTSPKEDKSPSRVIVLDRTTGEVSSDVPRSPDAGSQ